MGLSGKVKGLPIRAARLPLPLVLLGLGEVAGPPFLVLVGLGEGGRSPSRAAPSLFH